MESVSCLLCDCPDSAVRFAGRDRLHPSPETFTLVECRRCGFLYLSPRPDAAEIARYYPPDYLPFRGAIHEERSALRRLDRQFGMRKRAAIVRRYRNRGSLLDVGCGTGDFLSTMAAQDGWEVRGLEPQASAAGAARDKYGLTIDEQQFEDLTYPDGSFDAVTLWDVLEHVRWPRAALRRIHNLLRPGGVLVAALPNRDSWDARLFGPHWAGLDIPRHFSVFSVAHVERAVEEAGFASSDILNLNGGYHAAALSLRFWLASQANPSGAARILVRLAESLPARLWTLPYFSFTQALRRGSNMIVVARRI